MIKGERHRHLWRLLNQARGHVDPRDLPAVAELLRGQGETLSFDDLLYIARRSEGPGGPFMPPMFICRFVAELLVSREAVQVLDPVAGAGWLSAGVALYVRGASVTAVSDSACAAWLAEELDLRRMTIVREDPKGGQFDAIIGMPPIFGGQRNHRPSPRGEGRISDEPGLLQILDASDRLNEDGLIAWIVPPRFVFNNQRTSVRRNLRHFGLHLTGLFQIPAGTFAPSTPIPVELALIERQDRGNLFVASLPEAAAAQVELVARLRRREDGPEPAQGRVVTEKDFFGLDALEAAERAKRLASRRGLIPVPAREVLRTVERPRHRRGSIERLVHTGDAVYLPEMARTPATTSQEELPQGLQSYLQLVVDPERVVPEYLAGLLNTPLGYAIREAACTGATISRINRDRLLATTLYLPPRDDQAKVVQALKAARVLRDELAEFESELWERPRKADEIKERIRQVNHEDRFEDWIETLPFPLASILRAFHTVDRTDKDRYERLLHFFEALAAFCAIVHLSALRQDELIWAEVHARIHRAMENASGLSWTHPSFGLWKLVNEVCISQVRPMLRGKEEQKERARSLYALADDGPFAVLAAKPLLTMLQETNTFRNRWSGHGGNVSHTEATERLSMVSAQLSAVRSLAGRTFLQYQALMPHEMITRPGPIFVCEMRRAMGSNPQFERLTLELQTAPVSGRLCMHNAGHIRTLELLQLIQIQETPQPACYFFNRRDASGCHLVSYHHGDQSEIVDPTGDIAAVIADLETNT